MVANSLNVQKKETYFSEVENIIRINSKTFYFATNFLPKKRTPGGAVTLRILPQNR